MVDFQLLIKILEVNVKIWYKVELKGNIFRFLKEFIELEFILGFFDRVLVQIQIMFFFILLFFLYMFLRSKNNEYDGEFKI